ncbi:Alpha/Beta hydrolase protein [Schizophyllum fasciatum]
MIFPAITVFAALIASGRCAAFSRRDATPLSSGSIESYTPYANFAKAAYCLRGSQDWDCGDFVGYSPSLTSIVVAHGGIAGEDVFAALQDHSVGQAALNGSLFPGVGEEVRARDGFLRAHESAAEDILEAVEDTIAGTGAAVLTTVGHGLGSALAEIDAVYLRLNVPFIRMNTITFGKPRVGNAAWSDLVGANVDSYARINNMRDPIPVLPTREAAYEHPTGEVHIVERDKWVTCADNKGREDEDDEDCTIRTVPEAAKGELGHHAGPYGSVFVGDGYC